MNCVRMIVREKNKNKKQLDFKSGFENPKLILPNEKCCHEKNKNKDFEHTACGQKQNTLITYAPSYHC